MEYLNDSGENKCEISDRITRINDRMKKILTSQFPDEYDIPKNDKKFSTSVLLLAACTEHLIEFALGEPDLMLRKLKEFSEKITVNSIDSLSDYMNQKELDLNEENVDEIMMTSNLLKLNMIFREAIMFYLKNFRPYNIINILKAAKKYQEYDLLKKANSYALRHFNEISNQKQFVELSLENIVDLFKSNELNVSSEKAVFEALKFWLLHDESNRMKHLNQLLSLVKLQLLPTEYLFDVVNPFLHNKTGCNFSLMDNIMWRFIPERRYDFDLDTNPRTSVLVMLLVSDWNLDRSNAIDLYDPKTNTWSNYMNLNINKQRYAVGYLGDRLLLIGGDTGGGSLSSVDMLDLRTKSITSMPPLNYARSRPAIVEFDKYIYVIGGHNGGTCLSSVERWDPKTTMWSTVTPMLVPRQGCAAVVVGGKIHVVGGASNTALKNTEIYDPVTNKWTYGPDMLEKRKWVSAVNFGETVYVFGGDDLTNGINRMKTNEMLNPKTQKFEKIPDLLTNGDGICVTTISNKIYCVGGFHREFLKHFQVYDAESITWSYLAPSLSARSHCRFLPISRDIIYA